MSAFRIQLDVRWGDLDAFNHVGNVTYLRYVEECRAAWLNSVPSHWRDDEAGPVIANIHLNYRRPLGWPARIDVSLKPHSPGRSSIRLDHEIHSLAADGTREELHADGTTVIVWIDKNKGEPVPLPRVLRELAAKG
ncbi:MAG: acyl-CoA thioesterase [Wenzhouxiangella sp.]|nr:MAG: acyl-CoA thioesterase [Wenzhouxiangella sp.]